MVYEVIPYLPDQITALHCSIGRVRGRQTSEECVDDGHDTEMTTNDTYL